jgi:hypothetical protein
MLIPATDASLFRGMPCLVWAYAFDADGRAAALDVWSRWTCRASPKPGAKAAGYGCISTAAMHAPRMRSASWICSGVAPRAVDLFAAEKSLNAIGAEAKSRQRAAVPTMPGLQAKA